MKSVRIGYRTYKVKMVKRVDKEDSYGSCATHSGVIKIRAGQSPDEKANTIIHEILHGIWHDKVLGMSDNTEEKVVTALSNGLIALMRNNPKFMGQIQRMIDEA